MEKNFYNGLDQSFHGNDKRPYARWNRAEDVTLADIRRGDILVPDEGFACMRSGSLLEVHGSRGGLWVPCKTGKHFLSGQVDNKRGTNYIVGLRRMPK